MIKIEVCSLLERKSGNLAQPKYDAVKKWGFKHHLLNCKIDPSRNSIMFFDDKSFEVFKETFKLSWTRVY